MAAGATACVGGRYGACGVLAWADGAAAAGCSCACGDVAEGELEAPGARGVTCCPSCCGVVVGVGSTLAEAIEDAARFLEAYE